jgi:hypothetical protein
MSVATKIKAGTVLAVAGLLAYGIYPYVDSPDNDREVPFGPRKPGFNLENNCRRMSLDIEVYLTREQRAAGINRMTGILQADLGSGGQILGRTISVPDYALSRRYYKHEFCARRGENLSANVNLTNPVETVSCYFYVGPDADSDNQTKQFKPFIPDSPEIATWCKGVVPA